MKLTKTCLIVPLFAILCACNNQANTENKITNTQQTQEVKVTEAWARASVPGQTVGAAYMTLTSPQDSTLVNVQTPAADHSEIHSMTMDNGVMKMRMLEELALKAGEPEKLTPGGFHLMLIDLQKPLKAGENVELRLCFKDTSGKITEQFVTVPVKEAE